VFESNGDLKRKRKHKDRVHDIDILAEITRPAARKKRQNLDAHSRAQQAAVAVKTETESAQK
jgi:hypothetical protein